MTDTAPATRPAEKPTLSKASLAAAALLLLSGAFAVACCRALYADGAYHFLMTLSTRSVMQDWPSRLFANYLTGYPVVLAIDWGARSLRALTMLFTASLLYIPLLAYSAAIWIARDDRLLWTATAVVIGLGYFPTSFFMIGQFHLLYALFWLGFVIVLSGQGDRAPGALGMVAVASLLIRSYDLSIILCPALAGLCAWRAAVVADRRVKCLLIFAIGALLIAAWSGLQGVLSPADPQSKAEFVASLRRLPGSHDLRGQLGLLMLVIAAAFAPWRWLSMAFGAALVVNLGSVTTGLARRNAELLFGSAYDGRGRVFLLLVAVALIVVLLRIACWPRRTSRFAAWPPLLLMLWTFGVTLWDTAEWARYLAALCTELQTEASTPDFVNDPLIKKFSWGWTGPTMSVLLRPVGSAKFIVFHAPNEPSFEPFDPVSDSPDIAVFKAAGPICRDPAAH